MKIIVLLILILAVSCSVNITSGLYESAQYTQAFAGENPDHPYKHKEIPRISAYEVKTLYDQGKLILVNGQESTASERNHILGAIALPGDRFPSDIVLPQNMIIAIYCN